MKKYIQGKIEELKYLYPNEKITVKNGFLGIATSSNTLKHTTYLGNAYFEEDGVIYTDYNGGKAKKLITL